ASLVEQSAINTRIQIPYRTSERLSGGHVRFVIGPAVRGEQQLSVPHRRTSCWGGCLPPTDRDEMRYCVLRIDRRRREPGEAGQMPGVRAGFQVARPPPEVKNLASR